MVKRKYTRHPKIESPIIEQKEPELTICPVCHGTGIEESYYGFVSQKCRKCKGTGKVETPRGEVV